jgi:hypothetical protein
MKNRIKTGETKSLPGSLCPDRIRNSSRNRRDKIVLSRPVKPSPTKSNQIQPPLPRHATKSEYIRPYPSNFCQQPESPWQGKPQAITLNNRNNAN